MKDQKAVEPEVMSASDVRQHFGTVVNRVARGEGRIVVEKHGSPAVGIVSIEDVRRLRQLDARISEHHTTLNEFRARFQDVPEEELLREAEKASAEVKADMKRERLERERRIDGNVREAHVSVE